MDALLVSFAIFLDESLAGFVCIAVFADFTFAAFVQRRGSDIQVTTLNYFRHIAVEQCHDQCVDVRTIDVGIGHDDDLVVAQLVNVGFLAVFLTVHTKTYAQRLNDVVHFIAFERFVPHGFFYVQNLTAQWQDGLELTASSLLG